MPDRPLTITPKTLAVIIAGAMAFGGGGVEMADRFIFSPENPGAVDASMAVEIQKIEERIDRIVREIKAADAATLESLEDQVGDLKERLDRIEDRTTQRLGDLDNKLNLIVTNMQRMAGQAGEN